MRTQEVTIKSSSPPITLAGSLVVPPHARGAALLLQGSGPLDRDESIGGQRPFHHLARQLADRGIASLRVDDRGTGKSGGDYLAIDEHIYLDDMRGMVNVLAEQCPGVPRSFIGHSQGGLFALRLAQTDPTIDRVVLLASTLRPGMECLMSMREQMADDAGLVGDDRHAYLHHSRQLFSALADKDDRDERERAVRRLIEKSLEGASDDHVRPDFESIEEYVEFAVRDAMEWEVRALLLADASMHAVNLDRPVLAAWGDKDRHLDAPTEAAIAKRLGFKAELIPGLNHLFQRSQTGAIERYPDDGEPMQPPVVERVAEFLLAHR